MQSVTDSPDCMQYLGSATQHVLHLLKRCVFKAMHSSCFSMTANVNAMQVERNLASGAKNLFMPHALVAEQVRLLCVAHHPAP